MRREVLMAGFGGQGIVSMAVMLTEAAGYYEGLEVAQTQSYGSEARGGACRAEVVISDEEIDYIKTLNPDIFVAMSQQALDTYLPRVNPETARIFIDDTLVKSRLSRGKHVYRIPATRLAEEKCGSSVVANTIMLVVVAEYTDVISVESIRSVILRTLEPKHQDINLKAIEAALAYLEKTSRTHP